MNTIKFPLAVCALLSAATMIHQPAQARYHIWFNEPFLSDATYLDDWFSDMRAFQQQAMERMNQHFADFGPSKEDREAMKAARENIGKIKHDIKEDDQKITISFTGFENLTKNDVKVVKKNNGWSGTITTKDGKVEFFIAPNGIEIARRVELKKEEKADAQAKEEKDAQEPKKERTFYSSSLTSEVEYFKHLANMATVKAEPVTGNTFTLTIENQKEETLQIP